MTQHQEINKKKHLIPKETAKVYNNKNKPYNKRRE